VNKLRGINFCVDMSATPYFLGRVGQDTNRPFPWVVSDFGLIDAIESGLTKIPQLAIRDTTGAEIPGYFNIWRWILEQKLTPAERGGKKASPKPEAILKWANTPIAMLAGLWQADLEDRAERGDDQRPPVFIIVCKNTAIAKVMYEWIAEDSPPTGIPKLKINGFRNTPQQENTIRVDSKVVSETDDLTGAKLEEQRWMRFKLDTVGRLEWPRDRTGRPVYPEGFEELAGKLERPLYPPGRDVRCIVSVGMLTEGWDCNTVTHVIGLRPFMSQLLCEQVVGGHCGGWIMKRAPRANSTRRWPRFSACRLKSFRLRRRPVAVELRGRSGGMFISRPRSATLKSNFRGSKDIRKR